MRTRYGVSYWLDRYPKARQPSYPRLRGAVDADVAVVGGGLTGCAVAYACAAAGVSVVMLEADRLGLGGTAGCPGLLRLEPAVPFNVLQDAFGLERARAIWQVSRRAGLELAATIRRLKIRCDYGFDGALRAGLVPADDEPLKREMKALRAAGVEGTWLTPARLRQDTGLTGVGAVKSAGDGFIDPYRLALGLADAAVQRHAAIHERSAVTSVRRTRQGVEVTTERGLVRAANVVIAANYPPKNYESLRRHFEQAETYCVLTATLPSFVRRGFGRSRAVVIDQNDPAHVLRRTADDRLLVMGADGPKVQARANSRTVVQRTGQLMYEVSRWYPALSGVKPEYGWGVPVCLSSDGLPVVGPHRRYPGHFFAFGHGHGGVATAWLAARAAVRHCLGAVTPEDDLFAFSRLR